MDPEEIKKEYEDHGSVEEEENEGPHFDPNDFALSHMPVPAHDDDHPEDYLEKDPTPKSLNTSKQEALPPTLNKPGLPEASLIVEDLDQEDQPKRPVTVIAPEPPKIGEEIVKNVEKVEKKVVKKKKTKQAPETDGKITGEKKVLKKKKKKVDHHAEEELPLPDTPPKKTSKVTKLAPVERYDPLRSSVHDDKSDNTTQYSSITKRSQLFPVKEEVKNVKAIQAEGETEKKSKLEVAPVNTDNVIERLDSNKDIIEKTKVKKKKSLLKKKSSLGTTKKTKAVKHLTIDVHDNGSGSDNENHPILKDPKQLRKSSFAKQVSNASYQPSVISSSATEDPLKVEYEMAINPWNLWSLIHNGNFLKPELSSFTCRLYLGKVSKLQKYAVFGVLVTTLIDVAFVLVNFLMFMLSDCNSQIFNTSFFIFENFVLGFFIRFGILNFAMLEITGYSLFETKVPLLIPILTFGTLPVMQMPSYIFDPSSCNVINSLYSIKTANVMNIMNGILGLGAFLLFLIISICFSKCKAPPFWKKIQVYLYGLLTLGIAAYNLMFIMMSFATIPHFMPILLIDNLLYWGMILLSAYVFYQIKFKDNHPFLGSQSKFTNLPMSSPIHSDIPLSPSGITPHLYINNGSPNVSPSNLPTTDRRFLNGQSTSSPDRGEDIVIIPMSKQFVDIYKQPDVILEEPDERKP